MTPDASAILALLRLPGVGSATVHRVLAAASAVRMRLSDMLAADPVELMRILPPGLQDTASFVVRCTPEVRAQAAGLIARADERGVTVLTATEPGWPPALARLGSAMPPLLFIKGCPGLLLKPAAAVVGAREPSRRGARLASTCAAFFAGEGTPVVSGGARGVDTCAHLAALKAGGETIVVLPQGLLTYDLPAPIACAVDEGRAVVLSQFQPDTPWGVHAAVTRNATISALAHIVCVVEPRKTGGSIRAARIGVALGKPVAAWCSSAQVRRLLETAGVGELADHAGELRREYLRELACQNVQTAPVQPDLLNEMHP